MILEIEDKVSAEQLQMIMDDSNGFTGNIVDILRKLQLRARVIRFWDSDSQVIDQRMGPANRE